jgi:DNA-binding response OmpR family regulator
MTQLLPEQYRIVVIDDNHGLLAAVGLALTQAGYRTSTVDSGEGALELFKREGLPHLALVDINMPPGMDGFEFCEAIHEFSDLPIIMLTAVGDEETIVEAIEHHAEDYITKPFSTAVLLARVRRVLHSVGEYAGALEPSQMIDQHLRVSYPDCRLFVDDRPVVLTPTETKLLYILMRAIGQPVPAGFIMRRLWPNAMHDEGRLRVNVHRLRQKMEILEPKHRYIVARRNVGYSFVPYPNSF